MQRKIIAILLSVSIMHSYTQASDIMIVSENFAIAFPVVGTLISSGVAMFAPYGGQRTLGGIAMVASMASYIGLREGTPGQIKKRADGLRDEMLGTNLHSLMEEESNITVDSITRAYTGLDWFANASGDIEKYKPLLLHHKKRCEKARLGDVARTLKDDHSRLEQIATILPECSEKMQPLLDGEKKRLELEAQKIKNKKETAEIENAAREVEIKSQKMQTEKSATRLEWAKWIQAHWYTVPITCFVFAWSLRLLPFPSFAR